MVWLYGLLRKRPDSLLALLIEARSIDRERLQAGVVFRAGIKLGLEHPELAQSIIDQEESWQVKLVRSQARRRTGRGGPTA
jgi:hypothetical protein